MSEPTMRFDIPEDHDLPSYGADFIATDEQRQALQERRERFDRETPWKIDDIEIADATSLLGALMTRNARDLAWTRDCVESGLRDDLRTVLTEQRDMMRDMITLLTGQWAPNPLTLLSLIEDHQWQVERMYDTHCKGSEGS